MDKLGNRVVLNLGPPATAGGALVGLNLGVDWWSEEPPEPERAYLHTSASLSWSVARPRTAMILVGWGGADTASIVTSSAWRGAQRLEGNAIATGWGLTPLLSREGTLRWRTSQGVLRKSNAQPWRSMGSQSVSLLSRWTRPSLLGRYSALHWSSQAQVSVSMGARWLSSSSARNQWQGSWRCGERLPRSWRLRWGSAAKLPWIVRPPIPPDPDPEPGWPAGNMVGLNLGCPVVGGFGVVPLNLGVVACYAVRPQRRTYVVINTVSFVRLPDRMPIEVTRITLQSGRSAWGWTFDFELADPAQLDLLKPTAAGPRQFEVVLNGHVWTGIVESYQKQREFADGAVRLSGRSRTALLAAPYAPARVKVTGDDRSVSQLVAEELADTGFTSQYGTVDWIVPAGAWFYDANTPLDAISGLAGASGAVVQSDPAQPMLRVRASYPVSPWLWRDSPPDHVVQEDIVLTESLQMRSAPLYDAVVVTGELPGKGITCKVRKDGEAGQLFAQQVSSPLINVAAAAAERGRNILSDRGEQAAVDLTMPLFPKPLKPGEIGPIMPLDLVEVVGAAGRWHGQCESLRVDVVIDQQAVVIEQTVTLERHYSDAD